MNCPNCQGCNINSNVNERNSDEFTTRIECGCEDCGCEWNEIESIEIIKQGKEV